MRTVVGDNPSAGEDEDRSVVGCRHGEDRRCRQSSGLAKVPKVALRRAFDQTISGSKPKVAVTILRKRGDIIAGEVRIGFTAEYFEGHTVVANNPAFGGKP